MSNIQYGEVFLSPLDVVFSDTNVLQPDIIFVSKANSAIITYDNIRGAPDLLIEVISPNTEARDRTLKLKAYSKFGVLE